MADTTQQSISSFTMPTVSAASTQALYDAVVELNAVNTGRGSFSHVYQTLMTKFDRFGTAPVQLNTENVGYTFITRPRFNLSTESCRQDPVLAMLDTLTPASLMFSLRCHLDSYLPTTTVASSAASNSPFFNDQSAFNIPLSNMLIGVSGFPDLNIEYETTESGFFGEDMTYPKGSDWGRKTYTLNLTFREMQGGWIMSYFLYWLRCMALQTEGTIVAYTDDRVNVRFNHTVSIYRFVMDPNGRTIRKWAKATGCFPLTVPIGSCFDYGPGDSAVHASQQFTIPFIANNVSYMDPRHLAAFNTLVKRYCSGIGSYSKIPVAAASNFQGLPLVDLTAGTNELFWMGSPGDVATTATTAFTTALTAAGSASSVVSALGVGTANSGKAATATTQTTLTSPAPSMQVW